MAELIPEMTDDLQQIMECPLYNDPRVSPNPHAFCVDCLERRSTNGNSCPLCRKFQSIPDEGCGGNTRSNFKGNLVNLHLMYVEKNLKVSGEKIFDIPMVEQIRLLSESVGDIKIAWLENKIYVLGNLNRLHVYHDHAPFEKLPGIKTIHDMQYASGMTASASIRSILIGDILGRCIWKIQLPWKELSQISVDGLPKQLSITPDDDLLVVVRSVQDPDCASIDILRLTDFSRKKTIPLPRGLILLVGSVAAQSPNGNIVISHLQAIEKREFVISLLSIEGEIVKTFDYNLIIPPNSLSPGSFCGFAIMENGYICAADCNNVRRILLINPELSDYQVISSGHAHAVTSQDHIVYVKEKQQLLVQGTTDLATFTTTISVLNFSPCRRALQNSLGQ